jgi:hypothetical protein
MPKPLTETVTDDDDDTSQEEPVEESADDTDTEGEDGTETEEEGDEGRSDSPATKDTDQEEELLSEEEHEALKANPAALRKAYNRAFTQKAQKMAEQRRFIEAFTKDPVAVITQVAPLLGLKITPPETKAEVDEVRKTFEEQLGPEMAEKLMPAFNKMVEQQVAAKVKPLEEGINQQTAQAAKKQSELVLKLFQKKHPDWKKYEPDMLKLARQVVVAKDADMTEDEYLEYLYLIAARRAGKADAAAEAAERMNNAAGKADSTGKTRTAPGKRVQPTAPKRKISIRDAMEAAKRGEEWQE